MKIAKKYQKSFVTGVKKIMNDLGATELIDEHSTRSNYFQYFLMTRLGELRITLREEQLFLFTVSSVFLDDKSVELAREELGHWKHNINSSFGDRVTNENVEAALNIVRISFERLLPKKLTVYAVGYEYETLQKSCPSYDWYFSKSDAEQIYADDLEAFMHSKHQVNMFEIEVSSAENIHIQVQDFLKSKRGELLTK